MDKQMLTMSEVARRLNISYRRIWGAVAQQKLKPTFAAGRTNLFSEADLVKVKAHFAKE
jgi:excisionase family DNA binding protein